VLAICIIFQKSYNFTYENDSFSNLLNNQIILKNKLIHLKEDIKTLLSNLKNNGIPNSEIDTLNRKLDLMNSSSINITQNIISDLEKFYM
jgi:hypothetical protein